MNVLIPMSVGLVLLFAASRTYPFFLCRRLGVNDANPTPSYRFQDGRDYVPSRTHVVFAHHFAVIAGAGPIVGPTLALIYGYGPVWLWIIIGSVLFGAVHDMTSMFISMREDGRSIADMSRRTLGPIGYFLFLGFLIMVLTLINAIFLNLSCKALTAIYPLELLKLPPDQTLLHRVDVNGVPYGRIGGIATTSVFVITAFAPVMGWLVHGLKWPTWRLYVTAAVVCVASVIVGFQFPILLSEDTWRWVMSGYVFLACWVPVWLILQPRDFVNVQILYGGLLLMFIGLVIYGLKGGTMQAGVASVAQGTLKLGPIWPILLITVACGAISGFHSLAATGTTVKQISSEQDVRRVGYNAMILEGALALLVLVMLGSAMPAAEYRAIVYPDGKGGNPILGFAIAMGYLLHNTIGIPIAIGSVMGILVIEGFVVTTLDTSLRLCRYMLEEFWAFVAPGRMWLRNIGFNTALAVALMLFFALNSTIYSMWRIFGAGNQLIAALALTVTTVWLLQRGRSFWFALAPALVMTVTTFATLILFLIKNLVTSGTGPMVWADKERGPLCFAALVLLALAVGVVGVSLRKFLQQWGKPPLVQTVNGAGPSRALAAGK
ncbi:MAG: carbon starvation protein A [Candidatus Sumerlaeia bacterium]